MLNGVININDEIKIFMSLLELGCALVLLAFNFFIFHFNRKNKRHSTGINMVITSVAIVLITDVAAYYSRGISSYLGSVLVQFSNLGYFLSCNVAVWAMFRYSAELIQKKNYRINRIWHILNDINLFIATLCLLINSFTGFLFYIDEQNYYQRGQYFIVSQIPSIIGVLLLVLIIFIYNKKTNNTEKIILFSCVLLPLIAEIIQFFVYGFSWLPLSMGVAAFLLVVQYLITKPAQDGEYFVQDEKSARNMQTKFILIVSLLIIFFFGFITKVAMGFASDKMRTEVEARYQMLATSTSTQAAIWMKEEARLLLDEKAYLEINNDFDPDRLTEYFTHIVEDYNEDGTIYDLYFVNTDNTMSSGYGYVPDESIDFTQRDWYLGAVNTQGISYTPPYLDTNYNKYVVTLSVKVFDNEGLFRGVLAIDMFVDKLNDIMNEVELPGDSYIFIVDDKMGVMMHPNEEFNFVGGAAQDMRSFTDEYRSLARFIRNNKRTEDSITFTDYDGIDRSFFVDMMQGCEWYVVVAISSETINMAESVLAESIFISLIICLVLGIVLTLWATDKIIRQLRDAKAEANAANEAKSRFLANMSHEIRTPINAVLGMDEILLRECKDDTIREYATNIQTAGQNLLGIINDILDFSKIESDKLTLISLDYNLGALVDNSKNLIDLRAKEKGLEFIIERDEYLPKILHGDEKRIRQIVVNLLTNAVKYTAHGKVILYVGFEKDNEESGTLRISVKDTGMGIKQESLEVLFDSFQRLDEEKNRNIEGTGLGLSITKRLVDLMNGTITVDSVYGEGTEFVVVIPQKIIDGENLEFLHGDIEPAEDISQNEIEQLFEGKRILVVDDMDMNLRVAKGLLKDTGAKVDAVASGKAAIKMISKFPYDCIFLDHMMPEMSGIDTLEELKKNYAESIANVPIIMLTANAIDGAKEEYLNLGFSGYLSKPVTRESLINCLKEYIF